MSTKDKETGFEVRVLKDSKCLGDAAAEFVAEKIREIVRTKKGCRAIFATGASRTFLSPFANSKLHHTHTHTHIQNLISSSDW